jgi:pyruvate dehydrogenase (quinone)
MCGDGGFGMLMQEFATSVQHGLHVKVIVFNNAGWGLVHLEMEEAGMPAFKQGTGMRNPDFAMFAEACGGKGFRITKPGQLRKTLARALATEGPVVVDVAVDPAEIPAMPHLELDKVWKFGLGKVRELFSG